MANLLKEETRQNQRINTVLRQPETRQTGVASPLVGRPTKPTTVTRLSDTSAKSQVSNSFGDIVKGVTQGAVSGVIDALMPSEPKKETSTRSNGYVSTAPLREAETPKSQETTTAKQETSTSSNGYVSTAPLREMEVDTPPTQKETLQSPFRFGPAPHIAAAEQYKPQGISTLSTRKGVADELLGLTPTQRMGIMQQMTPTKRASAAYEPVREESRQASRRAAELSLQVKELEKQINQVQVANSLDYSPSAYAAGLQQTPKKQTVDASTKARLQTLQAELDQAEQVLAGQSYQQRKARLIELARMDTTPTATEWAEMEAGIQYLQQRLDAFIQAHGGILTRDDLEASREDNEAWAILRALTQKNPSTAESATVAALTAIPGVGPLMTAAERSAQKNAALDGVLSAEDYLPKGSTQLDYMKETHPTAYKLGKVGGDLAVGVAGAKALQAGAAALGLGPILSNALTYGTVGAVQRANDAATEGKEPLEVLKQGSIGLASGSIGGATLGGVDKLGTSALFKLGLQNNVLPNAANQALAAAAYSGSSTGTRALLDSDYNPTAGEVLWDMGLAGALAFTVSSISLGASTKANKARLDADLDATTRKYVEIIQDYESGNAPRIDALDDLAQQTAALRNTLNTTQYVGHAKEVKEALAFLDMLDDQISMSRAAAYGTMLPSNQTATSGIDVTGADNPTSVAGPQMTQQSTLQKGTEASTIETLSGVGAEHQKLMKRGKAPKLSRQEVAQVRSAQMQKFGTMDEVGTPQGGYVFAHDMFYVLLNYGPGNFRVTMRLDPSKKPEMVNEILEGIKDGDAKRISEESRAADEQHSGDDQGCDSTGTGIGHGGERTDVLRVGQKSGERPDVPGVLQQSGGDSGTAGGDGLTQTSQPTRSGPMSREALTDQILSRALPLPQGSGDGQMERVIREGIQKGLTKLAQTSEGKLALFNLALWKGDGFGKAFDDAIVDWVVWNTPDSPTEGSDQLGDALYTTLVDYFQNKLAGDEATTKPDEAKTKLTRPDSGSTIDISATIEQKQRLGTGKSVPKLSGQEWRQVQSAQIQKYAGMDEAGIPPMGYVFAHDKFYYIRNFGLGSFKVVVRLDPAKQQRLIDKYLKEDTYGDG